jgi:glycosyltransferase involved in cell wall biosynthesis
MPQPSDDATLDSLRGETLCLQAFGLPLLIVGLRLAFQRLRQLWPFLQRILFAGNESPARRIRALIHTWLGACYAGLLANREIDHIHVHHGYFGSWVGMVAANLLGVGFSMTLHGSDLLVDPAYLDVKLEHCSFCTTVSEFNRRHILHHYPEVSAEKIYVNRMGVDCEFDSRDFAPRPVLNPLQILCVGRLHPVKDHAFLVRACFWLKSRGLAFNCVIAGNGQERAKLERLIAGLGLEGEVKLAGHVPHSEIGRYYAGADLIVLTSRSEGIPLTLMEAMVREKIVLAPAIRDSRVGGRW